MILNSQRHSKKLSKENFRNRKIYCNLIYNSNFCNLDFINFIYSNGEGGDENLGLKLTLDRQTLLRSDRYHASDYEFGSFVIGINNADDAFNMRAEVVKAEIGKLTEILVTPTQYLASSNIRPLDLEIRQCRFRDEVQENMTIFKYYTQSACQFECLLKRSRKICRCTPWSYPFDPSLEEVRICDLYGHYCFDEYMRDLSKISECQCLPNCEQTMFAINKVK